MDQLKWITLAAQDDVMPKKKDLPVPEDHHNLVFMAKLSEQAERYDEMVVFMRKIVKINSELSIEERNLLSVAYKNFIGSRRTSWRIASSIESKERERGNNDSLPLIQMYRKQFEMEIGAVCDDIIQLLETYLIPAATGGEAKAFFLKMKGDYHRYYAETAAGDEQKNKAFEAYNKALEIANGTLASTHPIRLGLVLNFSVFYYEILKQTQKGLALAKSAYEEASTEIDGLDEETYKEATLIMQLLKDNIALWMEDAERGED